MWQLRKMLIYDTPLALCTSICLHHQAAFAKFIVDMKCQPPVHSVSPSQVHEAADVGRETCQSDTPPRVCFYVFYNHKLKQNTHGSVGFPCIKTIALYQMYSVKIPIIFQGHVKHKIQARCLHLDQVGY